MGIVKTAEKIPVKKLWSRREWACKNEKAIAALRIWQRIGEWPSDPNLRNQLVRRRDNGKFVGPTSKWIDAEKFAKFTDTTH